MLSILNNYSILYVEDEPEIQANIEEYLESYFKKVYLASDGKEALKLYQAHHPDVLLLDINIPYIDGLTLAKQIRQTDTSTKIVMLTGVTHTHKLLEATELKLTKYLVKPISPKIFKETMKLLSVELTQSPSDFIEIAKHCIWNKRQKMLSIDDKPIVLLEKELKLLEYFIQKKGYTVHFEEIMLELWEDAFEREISIESVKNQVSHLRKKLPKNTIVNVYGQGYKLI
jgi:DNA-binding response OmpR family regulator